MKNLSDVVSKEAVKKTVYKKLNTDLNKLEKEDFWCNYFNLKKSIQYWLSTFEEKIGNVENKILDVRGLVTTTFFNTKIKEGENKITDTTNLMTTSILNTKTKLKTKIKIPDISKKVKNPILTLK